MLQMKWLMENVPKVKEAAEQGQLMMGNIDAWLIW
jgi:glycerol kinase